MSLNKDNLVQINSSSSILSARYRVSFAARRFIKKGTAFIEGVIAAYQPVLKKIESFWSRGSLTDPLELQAYFEATQEGTLYLSTCFYVGLSEETPEPVKRLVVAMREQDELFAHSDEFIRDCMHALGRERELGHLVMPEEFIQGIPADEELRRREQGAVLIDGRVLTISFLEKFAVEHPEIALKNFHAFDPSISELKGQVAQSGRARGLVRIVKNRKHLVNVQAGDIMVSPMTTPDFLPAMKRAAAFVTDEGGITCHAAIVSREMGKPCIIGTKIATQVLKDGDEVEVDAEKGVVRMVLACHPERSPTK